MLWQMIFRDARSGDAAQLAALYAAAVPNEDLVPLVQGLLAEVPDLLSLTAEIDGRLAGHVIFTPCGLDTGSRGVALLGPLAVTPSLQQRGVGSALVRGGLGELRGRGGCQRVVVLGAPSYYGRFGFEPERSIQSPYPLPAQWRTAWQGLTLSATSPPTITPMVGTLQPPAPWLVPSLWAP